MTLPGAADLLIDLGFHNRISTFSSRRQSAPALMQLSELGVDTSTNVTIAGDSRCRRAAVRPPLAQGLHRLGYWARSACARRFPAAT